MTEKRFKVKSERINNTYSIHILENGKVIFEVSNWNSLSGMHKKECEELVDIINEIVDENEQLKKELKRCKEWINSDKNDYELTLSFIKNKGYSLKDVLEYEKELKK